MLSLLVVLRVLSKGGSCNSHFSQLTRKECQIPRIGLFELSKITSNKEEEEKNAWNWKERRIPIYTNAMAKGYK